MSRYAFYWLAIIMHSNDKIVLENKIANEFTLDLHFHYLFVVLCYDSPSFSILKLHMVSFADNLLTRIWK